MNFLFHLATLLTLYMLLALSLNLIVGYTGLLSLSHAAFFGIGAYVAALLILKGLPFLLCVLLSALAAGLVSVAVSWPSLRLRGDYFVLATLGIQSIISGVFENWAGVTGGSSGLRGIPRPVILSFSFEESGAFFFLTLSVSFFCIYLLYRLAESSFGRSLKAIREDELAAMALGHNVFRLKIQAFVCCAVAAAVAGALFAPYMRSISPGSFTLLQSISFLSLVIIGGSGNMTGPIVGTMLLVLVEVIIQLFGGSFYATANLQQIAYGLLIIGVVRWRPQGLAGEYRLR